MASSKYNSPPERGSAESGDRLKPDAIPARAADGSLAGNGVWVLTDGRAGNRNQAVGLAEALGLPFEEIVGKRAWWLDWLPGNITWGARIPSPYGGRSYPDILITCGRRSAAFSLAMKKASGGKTFTIHLLDPRIATKHFDLVVAPQHDALSGENVLVTRGSLHNVTPERLHSAAVRWQPAFAHLPKPWVGVLLGGSTNKYTLTPARFAQVMEALQRVLDTTSVSLLIAPSRRTGSENIAALKARFAGNKRVYLYDMQGDNSYLGMLALADFLFVTNDSVNMLSEATFTGKPVYVLPLPEHTHTKPARFAGGLLADGTARIFLGTLEAWSYLPLDDCVKLVSEINVRVRAKR